MENDFTKMQYLLFILKIIKRMVKYFFYGRSNTAGEIVGVLDLF